VVIRWHCYPGDLLRLFPQCQHLLQDPRILCLHLYRQGGCSRSDPLQPRGSVTQRDIFVTSTPRSQCPGEPDIISRQRAVFFPSHHERVSEKKLPSTHMSSGKSCLYFLWLFSLFCFHFHLIVFFFSLIGSTLNCQEAKKLAYWSNCSC
jgi:hypothetical protein